MPGTIRSNSSQLLAHGSQGQSRDAMVPCTATLQGLWPGLGCCPTCEGGRKRGAPCGGKGAWNALEYTAEGKVAHLQDDACPHAGFALLEGNLPAIQSRPTRDEHRQPAEREPDVCVGVNLLEEVWPGEELDKEGKNTC